MVVTGAVNRRWQKMDRDAIDLLDLARHFEFYNRTEGKSDKTVCWYNQAISSFYRFLVRYKKPTNLGNLGEMQVREFILYLQERTRWQENPYVSDKVGKIAAITIQTHVRALRSFFNWLYGEGYATEHKLAKLKPPKAPTKVVEVLSQDEISRLLKCINPNKDAGARHFAILMLLLDSGLRCGEMRNFRIDDINFEGGYIKVMGKGKKERIVPFDTATQKALLSYSFHFRPEPLNPIIENFFLTIDGKPLSVNCIKMMFQRIAKKSGIKRLHPHLCRHTFATNYLINGGDVFSLQQILGHTTLEMVGRYITLASMHVTVQHRKYSPMDRATINYKSIVNISKKPKKYSQHHKEWIKQYRS